VTIVHRLSDSGFLFPLVSVVMFTLVAIWETFRPQRPITQPMGCRWACNLSLTFLNGIVARLAAPVTGVAISAIAASQGFGLFNNWSPGLGVVLIVSVPSLDLAQYWAHRWMHRARWLWLIHRVHHSDLDFDLSTGFRFHPFEAALMMVPRAATIAALGVPVSGVLLHGLLTYLSNLFQHANVAIGEAPDRTLRRVIVTPGMHGVHHQVGYAESNSNFGTLFSFWDKLFGTYRESEPASRVVFGLPEFREVEDVGLRRMLLMPFLKSG
jgi:sterol desaturase/sphingolipid hydroxylase (fatty acid hydroxylase superfamily)